MTLLLLAPLRAQDPALEGLLAQAKQLWSEQGDREGASTRLQQVLAALEPMGPSLSPAWRRTLLEAHAWMAVLDDRQPARRPMAQKHLEAALDLDPDAEFEKVPMNARLTGVLEALRAARFGRLVLPVLPEGTELRLDGRPVKPGTRHVLPGEHVVEALKPGHRPIRETLTVALKETRPVPLALTRIATTLTFELAPGEATVTLNGRLVVPAGTGATRTVVVDGLGPGDHLLEIAAPCHRMRRIAVPATLTEPLADHVLEAVHLVSAQGRLELTSPMPGGRARLGDRDLGPLPLTGVGVCPGRHLLRVDFPEGAFTREVEVQDGATLTLVAQPLPRLLSLGLAGTRGFAGRERLERQLEGLGARLARLVTSRGTETPETALARLKTQPNTELVLWAEPVDEEPVRHVDVVVTTLKGEQARVRVKPLQEDPLEAVARALDRFPALEVRHGGMQLVDLPGQPGPWVVEADPEALAAGVVVGQPLLQVGGKAVATAAEARKALAEAPEAKVMVQQGGRALDLPIQTGALEIPRRDASLCYPAVLAQLRLLQRQAPPEKQGMLAFHEAMALLHFEAWERAAERLRDARTSLKTGVSQGTLDYHTGICLMHLGRALHPEARQALEAATRHPGATLWGPEGPRVAPLARQRLDSLRP